MIRVMTFLSIALCAIPYAGLAVAEEHGESIDGQVEPERCISLSRLDSTEVVDDRNILFRMRDGTIYRNILAHRCAGLANQETFMYRTPIGQLCDLDLITVLNNVGFGFTHGPSCGLGEFYPISEDEATVLKKNATTGS